MKKNAYILHEDEAGNIYICKVLNRYEDKEEAINVLARLLTKKITERQLLKEFDKKLKEDGNDGYW